MHSNLSFEKASVLIDKIYQAGADPNLWPEVTEAIRRAVGGHSVNFVLQDKGDMRLNYAMVSGVPADRLPFYEAEIMPIDKMTELHRKVPIGKAFSSDEIVSDQEMLDLEVTQRFYDDYGYHRFGCTFFYAQEERSAWLSIVRSVKEETFSRSDIALIQTISPHLSRAFQLNQTLLEASCRSRILLNSLDNLSVGLFVLSKAGKVLTNNSKALTYLDGMALDIKSGRFWFENNDVNRWFERQLMAACAGDVSASKNCLNKILTKNGEVNLQIYPYQATEAQYGLLLDAPGAIVVLSDTRYSPVSADILRALYDLTHREAKVLALILQDCETKKIAQAMSISTDTVRLHIKNIFVKAQVNSRVELVGKVNRAVSRLYTL